MNLEEKIKTLEGQFDIEEPSIGHFNRFEARLQNKRKKKPFNKFYLVASVVLLFVVIGFKLFSEKANTNMVTPEFKQTENYFSTVINDELKKVVAQKNADNQQIISDAFLQMKKLEDNYKQLQKDLKNTQNKKAIIYAMLDNYQQRIKILQNLLNTLNQYKQLKNTNYEIQNI